MKEKIISKMEALKQRYASSEQQLREIEEQLQQLQQKKENVVAEQYVMRGEFKVLTQLGQELGVFNEKGESTTQMSPGATGEL